MTPRAGGVLFFLVALVIARSAVLVCWPSAHFDSDQAVIGLMAKHLSELRAFPVFLYGQAYMLGVEAWLAAPLMAIAGPTVTALKLPILVMNLAIALLLFRGFTREMGLSGVRAAVATLPFVLTPPITAAHFLAAHGGNVETLLYVLLLWLLRGRPVWFGLVAGVGFLNREFTIYGVAAIVLLDAGAHTLFTRDALRRYGVAAGTAAAAWIVFIGLRQVSSAAGPGTSIADLATTLAANNLLQIAERICVDARAIVSGAGQIATIHWPTLFGLEPLRLSDIGIESSVRQGLAGSAWLLLIALGIPLVRLAMLEGTRTTTITSFARYLVLTATLSVAGYLAGRCGAVDFYTTRYELLSVLGACGVAAWYLRIERSRLWAMSWGVAVAAILALSVDAHARLMAEYLTTLPVGAKQELIHALDARGVRYAYSDFWTAYYVSFMTRERIVVASDEIPKVRTYNRLVDAHRDEAISISRQPCPGGEPLTPAFWSCPPRGQVSKLTDRGVRSKNLRGGQVSKSTLGSGFRVSRPTPRGISRPDP